MSFWVEIDEMVKKGKTGKQIKVVVSELVEFRRNVDKLKSNLDNAEENLEEKIEIVKKLSMGIEELKLSTKNDLDNLQSELTEKNIEISERNNQIDILQSKITENDTMIAKIQEEYYKLKKEISKHDEQLNSAKTSTSDVEQDLNAKNQQINQIQTEMNNKNSEIIQLQTQISEMQKKLNETTGTPDIMAQKDQEIAQIREKINSSEVASQLLHEKIPKLQLKIQNLQSKIQELESTTITRADYDKLFNQNREMEGTINNLNIRAATLSNKNEKLMEELSEKIKKIQSLTEPRSVMAPSITKSVSSSTFQTHGSDTSRIVCPHCGSLKISIVDDKSRIISYIPQPVYAKKNVCSQCGFEF